MGMMDGLDNLKKIAKEQEKALELQKRMVESYHLTLGMGNATISTQITRGTDLKEVEKIVKEIKAIFKLL